MNTRVDAQSEQGTVPAEAQPEEGAASQETPPEVLPESEKGDVPTDKAAKKTGI